MRMCVGCRERSPKSELLRVTLGADADGHAVVVPDPMGTAPGRGAHLHPTPACLELAERRRAFARALRWEGGHAPSLERIRKRLTDVAKTEQELEQ